MKKTAETLIVAHLQIAHISIGINRSRLSLEPNESRDNGLPALLAICSHCILSICDIYLFPVLVLRAGFAFLLLQFLFTAFLLLLYNTKCATQGQLAAEKQVIL